MDQKFSEKILVVAVLLAAFAVGWVLAGPKQTVQVPVPTPVAPVEPARPSCPDGNGCSGGLCRRHLKPFAVSCPYCRQPLTVIPPQAGDVGAVVKAEVKK